MKAPGAVAEAREALGTMTARTIALMGSLLIVVGTGGFAATASDLSEADGQAVLDAQTAEHLSPYARGTLADPVHGMEEASQLGGELADSPPSRLSDPLEVSMAQLHDANVGAELTEPGPLAVELDRSWTMHAEDGERPAERSSTQALPDDVERALAWLVKGARVAEEIRPDVAGAIADEDLAFLVEETAVDDLPGGGGTEAARLVGPGEATNLLDHEQAIAPVDQARLLAAHATMAAAVDRAIEILEERPTRTAAPAPQAGGQIFNASTPYGPIVVGGTSDDTYTEQAFATVDLGGDDRYENGPGAARADVLGLTGIGFPPSPASPSFTDWANDTRERIHASHNVSLSLDLVGNDTYAGTGPGTQGFGAFGGFGALVDLTGNDTYTASELAQGSGVLGGAGLLLDPAGVDRFSADWQAQGYAQDAGVGWLLSGTGPDEYTAELLAQGTGFVTGLSAGLVDGGGDDVYRCTGVADFSDYVLPVSVSRPGSVCQGTGFGGTGVLVDAGGSDTYETASSFRAMALLGTGIHVDRGGHDTFDAGEWSNGAGIEGVSVLVAEGSGDDRITSQMAEGPWIDTYVGSNGEGYLGVGILATGGGNDEVIGDVDKTTTNFLVPFQYACSIGCAYTGGVGLVHSTDGDDLYRTEVGQGAGVNATGLLVDEGGDDRYETLYASNRTQGYAEGHLIVSECTLGLLHDRAGQDTYDNPVTDFGQRGDGQHWGQNDYGRGMDDTNGTLGYASGPGQDDLREIVSTRACDRLTGLPTVP